MLLETLLQRLREFFVDVTEANVTFHLGDLFDPSHFRLRDVFLKTEVINALHLPFELKAVYIGDVKVEGVLGFVAGSPLTIGVDNVCLVLGHKPVDWNNELALRYARELLLAILQSIPVFPVGAYKPKQTDNASTTAASIINDSSFSLSPAKWILNKILTTIAETTVKLERLHIRFESEYEGQLIAYGAHIPTLQLSTSDLDDHVLRRREQPGVTYPADSSDLHKACKRLYIANIALYCDLHATSYLGPSPPRHIAVTTPRGSATALPSVAAPTLTPAERLAFMRQQCLAPLAPSADRDLVLISALWLKFDFVRGVDTKRTSPSAWGLGAVDVVTEEIKVNVDFTQLAALSDELARVTDFVQREQRRAWRPSCVDRERVAPLQVTLSPSAVLPLLTDEISKQLTTDKPPRSLTRAWLRGMWRYAAHCVLVAARNGDARRVRLGKTTQTPEDEQRQREAEYERYKALYPRSLSDENLRVVLFGRLLLPSSPRATDTKGKPHEAISLPVFEPLTLAEQWELSDLVETLPAKDQRVMRREVAQRVRREHASHLSSAAALNATGVSTRTLSVEIPDSTVDLTTAGASGTSISPKHSSSGPTPATSPASSLPESLPPDFVANHHHHTRSRAESSPAGSPTKHNVLSPPSPTSSVSSHPHLTHSASAPIARHKALSGSPTATKTAHMSFRSPQSPTNLMRQQWLIESVLPSWLLKPSRVIPLVNWHIGPVSVRLHHRTPAEDSAPLFPGAPSRPALSISTGSPSSSIPPRLSDSFMEFHLESCSGCALLCKVPSVSLLVELRLGLVRATLVDFASSAGPSSASTGNTIRTDYIREPSDGFLYLGLKYNFKHATRVASLLAPVEEELWDVKAKLCVGTIHIEYNDMAVQTAMRTDLSRRPSFSSSNSTAFAPISDPFVPLSVSSASRLDSASYVTVVHDVLTNWKTFIQRVQPPKPPPSPAVPAVAPSSPTKAKQLKQDASQARVAKLLNAFLQQSSCIDVDVNGIELQLSVLTSHVVERVRATKDKQPGQKNALPLPLFDSEQVHITLPSTGAGLQNRPLLNECQVQAGGARVKFRTTKQGRAAVVDHVLQRLFPPVKREPEGVV